MGVILSALIGIFIVFAPSMLAGSGQNWGNMDARWTAWRALRDIPVPTWQWLRPMFTIIGVSVAVFSALALYFVLTSRRRLAAAALAAGMIPAGLSMSDGVAHVAPYFSLADAARFLNPKAGPDDKIVFEGPLDDASSLVFYLDRKFFLLGQNRQKEAPFGVGKIDIFVDEAALLEKWGTAEIVYLITDERRATYWQQLLTDRFHIFHRVTACGTYVVLSNEM
jgi:hypothetical protein